ncbi:MAG: DUF2950 domain-containing protein [Deltaproteobacteria bacterium]
MKLSMIRGNKDFPVWFKMVTQLALILTAGLFSISASAATIQQKTFDSPEKAVQALVDSIKKDDKASLKAILGPKSKPLLSSGDPVADRYDLKRFVDAYDKSQRLDRKGKEKALLVIGTNDWPFPIPLVMKNNRWRFDTVAGGEEIMNRRIGRNELGTIQTSLAIIDAQREYATSNRGSNGLPEYAARLISDPGKKNGLYWESREGEPPSPLGELVAKAKAEGYDKKMGKNKAPAPYQGYLYRILTAQGESANGGAYDYRVKGHLIGGIAVVAYPARYGSSGIMTFIVNHDGLVYQKNLGRKTVEIASKMELYNPGPGWTKVETPASK